MPDADLFVLFVRPLNQAGIRYIIGGSIAAIFYGEPRMTGDVDFVVFLRDSDIQKLSEIFPQSEFYVPSTEIIRDEVRREGRGHFNIIHTETIFKADFYPTGRDDLGAWAFRNKRTIEFKGETLVLAPPEYVIVKKLEYYREGGSDKHLRDIRSMLLISGEQMDHEALNEWIRLRGVEREWQKVRK
jgi:hypothetical protein